MCIRDSYNSVTLASILLSKNTYCMGTLCGERKHNPKKLIEKKLVKGEMTAQYIDGIMVGKWRDKHVVRQNNFN